MLLLVPSTHPPRRRPGIRLPPRPPEYVVTMRMEDMLLAAAEAAAVAAAAGSTNGSVGHTVGGTGIEADEFRQALARYQRHPGVQRKLAEGERAARARREVRAPRRLPVEPLRARCLATRPAGAQPPRLSSS